MQSHDVKHANALQWLAHDYSSTRSRTSERQLITVPCVACAGKRCLFQGYRRRDQQWWLRGPNALPSQL